jgi:hypothetical protein
LNYGVGFNCRVDILVEYVGFPVLLYVGNAAYINTVPLTQKDRGSSVCIATGNGLDDRGSGIRFPAVAWNFPLIHRFHTGSGAHPTSYPVGTGVKPPGREADDSPPFCTEVKNAWCSVKHRDNFTFTFCLSHHPRAGSTL